MTESNAQHDQAIEILQACSLRLLKSLFQSHSKGNPLEPWGLLAQPQQLDAERFLRTPDIKWDAERARPSPGRAMLSAGRVLQQAALLGGRKSHTSRLLPAHSNSNGATLPVTIKC